MVSYLFLPIGLSFLHCIVQEEVNEDGVDVCFRVPAEDLPFDELNAPDTTTYFLSAAVLVGRMEGLTSKLQLPRMATVNRS